MIKAKSAPAAITTAKQAREAVERLNAYRVASQKAQWDYFQSNPGTATANKHYDRYEAYGEVADGWYEALLAYFDTPGRG
jgi:hypothetical protein